MNSVSEYRKKGSGSEADLTISPAYIRQLGKALEAKGWASCFQYSGRSDQGWLVARWYTWEARKWKNDCPPPYCRMHVLRMCVIALTAATEGYSG